MDDIILSTQYSLLDFVLHSLMYLLDGFDGYTDTVSEAVDLDDVSLRCDVFLNNAYHDLGIVYCNLKRMMDELEPIIKYQGANGA